VKEKRKILEVLSISATTVAWYRYQSSKNFFILDPKQRAQMARPLNNGINFSSRNAQRADIPMTALLYRHRHLRRYGLLHSELALAILGLLLRPRR
jgi:hypothetical protein